MDTNENLRAYITEEMDAIRKRMAENNNDKRRNEIAISHNHDMDVRYQAELFLYRKLLYRLGPEEKKES